jgi:hypothetical protein
MESKPQRQKWQTWLNDILIKRCVCDKAYQRGHTLNQGEEKKFFNSLSQEARFLICGIEKNLPT